MSLSGQSLALALTTKHDREYLISVSIIRADPPTFLEPLKDQVFHLHQNGKLECRVLGIPYPSVQFKKDWRAVAGSHRVKTVREGFDHWTLNIQNCIHMDEGVYECVAENVAGKVYCTAAVKITGTLGYRRRYIDCSQHMIGVCCLLATIDPSAVPGA